jgi:DNA-binding NarL/FixJ family response regulator
VLIDMPRMLRELIRTVVAEQPDLMVVAELDDGLDLGAELESNEPDFVIVGTEHGHISTACRALFERRPRLRVLAIATDGDNAVVWELAPRRVLLGELSPDSLLAAIRDARPWRWEP